MDAADQNIHELLRAMGLTRVYRGYDYLFYILRRDQDEPQWLALGNKQVCLDVARAFNTTPAGVDSALRTRHPHQLAAGTVSAHRPGHPRPAPAWAAALSPSHAPPCAGMAAGWRSCPREPLPRAVRRTSG